MSCDGYLELLALRPDGELSEAEERELEEHLAACPACRAAGAQLAALQAGFAELEDVPAPEGFAQGVMDRIRALETEQKVLPLFKRPRFKALAGLAACAALAVGLYGAACFRQKDEDFNLMTRSFNKGAVTEFGDISTSEIPQAVEDPGDPMIAAYAAPEATDGVASDIQKAVPAAPMSNTEVLTLDHMPEGGWELIPPETPVSPEGISVTGELLEQIKQLAAEQGITAEVTSNAEWAEEFILVVLEETE